MFFCQKAIAHCKVTLDLLEQIVIHKPLFLRRLNEPFVMALLHKMDEGSHHCIPFYLRETFKIQELGYPS